MPKQMEVRAKEHIQTLDTGEKIYTWKLEQYIDEEWVIVPVIRTRGPR
jgi:hypothetical protein